MPLYQFQCAEGHGFERFVPLAEFEQVQACDCGQPSQRVIGAPMLVSGQPECRYDSPIDGRPITTWAQRRDDLARSNCRPYDPEMKTDYQARVQASARALDESVGQSVEEAIAKMPTATRAKLYSELTEQGAHLNLERRSVPA